METSQEQHPVERPLFAGLSSEDIIVKEEKFGGEAKIPSNLDLQNAPSFTPQSSQLDSKIHLIWGPNNKRLFHCQVCSFHSKYKVSVERHVKLHNREQMEHFRCHICSFKTLYRRHLHVHIKALHQTKSEAKLYRCDQCSYGCNYRENLTRHKKTHLSSEERDSFVCEICKFETLYKKSYRVHMEMIHQIVSTAKVEETEFKCYHCPFETKYRVNIVRHLKTHMKGNATVYKCSDCDFQTIHKNNFNTHVLRHKDPGKIRMYQCQHCSHKTSYKASLRSHLKLHMKKEEVETFKCDICDFATLYERSYKLHMLYIHNANHQAIEYFKCQFCSFKTRYRENWRRHEKQHAKPGKKEYKCAECSFSTCQPGRYEKHVSSHQGVEVTAKPVQMKSTKRFRRVIDEAVSGEYATTDAQNIEAVIGDFKAQNFSDGQSEEMTMFQCCHCAYKTLNMILLDEHLTRHQLATECEERKGDVFQIQKSQPQKKLFNCEICHFTTVHRGSMRRHKETHLRPHERKQYKCPTCPFRSFTRSHVNGHICPNRPDTEVL
ncbi:oocyte zinc finger protein XlCOF28-like [Euwallacea fornicatus]|uniref:oocyte zinc finger protein XlCOF28-like n=1 Tax=Euwallacea fornicatus TaxID=995702 RepID=UPI00338DED61